VTGPHDPDLGEPVSWDPRRYLGFGEQRLRPALDLLARVDVAEPEVVHDVGCGTGALARAMAARWPQAAVIGSDESPAMLDEARRTPSPVTWRHLDVREWDPAERVDVVTANAVLHWVPDHDDLILRLFSSVRPGGALAFQMPRSWSEPSHVATARLTFCKASFKFGRSLVK
jgi:trans-aconitate 2-methyltransferase